MPKYARRITVVPLDGASAPIVIYTRKRKRKDGDPWLRPDERVERYFLRANQTFASELVRLHERSNRRKRDGWILDAVDNVYKATRAGYRTYRKIAPQLLPK